MAESSFDTYLREIQAYDLLTADEEKALARRVQNYDVDHVDAARDLDVRGGPDRFEAPVANDDDRVLDEPALAARPNRAPDQHDRRRRSPGQRLERRRHPDPPPVLGLDEQPLGQPFDRRTPVE